MYQHCYRRQLPVVAITLIAVCTFVACNSRNQTNDEPKESPMPRFIEVDDLPASLEDAIGDRVILEGNLLVNAKGEYELYLASNDTSSGDADRLRIILVLRGNDDDSKRMADCMNAPVLVTGKLKSTTTIVVDYVKLKSDAVVHKPTSCYQLVE